MSNRKNMLCTDPPFTPPGQVDFFRIHAYALDRLGDVLALLLPDGAETDDARWIGSHPKRPLRISVSLLTGCWEEVDTGRTGRDLVSLVAHMFGIRQGEAARRLARSLGVGRRYG